ncbi:hypothetical protein B0H19DRAFT_1143108 [Mycena capillaripes]|nr:hypothetical protein B0H19DRAFT_1143108 [Mycena capillaripes]
MERGFRLNTSNMAWSESCGWNCPVSWRHVQGLCGVGLFYMKDNGYTGLAPMKWRLGDTCKNTHCPWFRALRQLQERTSLH